MTNPLLDPSIAQLFARAPLAVVAIDEAATIGFWNRAAEVAFGWAADEAVGRSFTELAVPVERRDAFAHWLERSGNPRAIGHSMAGGFVARGGRLFQAECTAAARVGRGDVLFIRDITDRCRVERELEESLSVLSATLESTADGILVVDRDGAIVHFNGRFVALWAVPGAILEKRDGAEALAHMAQRVTGSRQFLDREREIAEAAESESEDTIELSDGRVFERYSRPKWIGRRCVGRVWSFRDVTERKKVAQQLQVSDRMASVGTLAAGVAHEINNPLTYVSANLELLGEELRSVTGEIAPPLLDSLREMVSEARDGAERVRRIVRDLKTFSSNRREEHRAPVDLRSALDLSVNMTRNEVHHRARLVVTHGAIPLVDADESRLGQVFINLLVNAAHAIPEGRAAENEIHLVTRTDEEGYAVVDVIDTGTGIAADVLPRIFDPFFSTKPVGEGSGLGLAICHGIVTSHGGHLLVESAVGKGSTFRVRLPPAIRPRALEPTPHLADARPSERRGRILISDDQEMVGIALQRALRGHDVTFVTSGQAGLTCMKATRFDLILCDVMMPEMTGIDVHAAVARMTPELLDRMVFITGGAFSSTASTFLQEVTNARIEKPIRLGDLRQLVERFIGPAKTCRSAPPSP